MSQVPHTTDQLFDADVLAAQGVQVVDFTATWCAPCRSLAPTLDALAAEFGERVAFQKLDVDENPATASRYGIRGLPTLLVFRDGALVDRIVGAVPKDQLKRSLEKHLA